MVCEDSLECDGSCAEIPCVFDYPDTYSNPWILWLKGGSDPRTPVVSVISDSAELERAAGRIELKGKVTEKQFSLLIKDFKRGDGGDYYIRVKMTTPWDRAEDHLQKIPVSLSILDKLRISVPGQLIAGKPAQFTCSLTQSCSVPELKLEWIGEESPFLPGALTSQHTRNSLEDSWMVSLTFSFTPSLDQHGESLTCKLISGDGQTTVQESLRLDVQSPTNLCVSGVLCKPILNSSIVSVEGSSFLFYCKASGIPPVNLTLSRHGVEISNSPAAELKLFIHNVSSEDEGEYWCEAANNLGTARSSTHISVQCGYTLNRKLLKESCTLDKQKLHISVLGQLIAGKPARFTCSLTQSCSVPEFNLEWIEEESPFLPGALTSQHTRNSLEDSWTVSSTFSFTPSLDQHGESLTCKLISGDGQTTVQESLRLDVQCRYLRWDLFNHPDAPTNLCVSGAPCKPIFNSSIVSVEGSSFLLCCKASGIPPVNLTLSRRGVEISNSRAAELKLFIHNVSSEDEGEYWCEAANNLGTARSSTHISVQYRPTIVSDLNCTSLKNVHCICRVKANPAANITWNLGGRNIIRNISEIAPHLLESSLRLTHPTGSENLILCMAQNEHGVSVREYRLDSPGPFWDFIFPIRVAVAIVVFFALVALVTMDMNSHRYNR
ncbi:myelin-associated glycoprotein-like [Mustelus asterias]